MSSNKKILLFLGDFVFFQTALLLTLIVNNINNFWLDFQIHFLPFLILFIFYELLFFLVGFWNKSFLTDFKNIFDNFFPYHILFTFFSALFFYFLPFFSISPKTNLLFFSFILFVFILFWKWWFFNILSKNKKKAVLIGENKFIESFFEKNTFWNLKIIKKIKENEVKNFREFLENEKYDFILVDFEKIKKIDNFFFLLNKKISFIDFKDILEEVEGKVDPNLDLYWIKSFLNKKNKWLDLFMIRLTDIFLAILLFFIFIFLLPLVAFLIKKEDGGKIFIKMPRIGRNGKIFYILKFRTMTEGDKLFSHNKKVTRIGSFLRKHSIDELPQSISILKGEMSFIGPRPEIPELVKQYEKEIDFYKFRHLVKPGLSGWAQIKQKKAPHHDLDYELTKEKIFYDFYFIKNYSYSTYLKIILKSLRFVLNRKSY